MKTPISASETEALRDFLANFRAAIIVLTGEASGLEFVLDQRSVLVGRGPGVDLAVDEESLAGAHAEIEFRDRGFHLCALTDAGRTRHNGVRVRTDSVELKSEDRFRLGELEFAYSLEPRRGSRRS